MGEEAKQEEAKAETQPEKKAEEKPEEKKEEAPPPPPPPIILFVDMHCVGCAKRVERCIMKFKGVEGVEIDMVQNQVTVKGMLDPHALCMRIQKKTKRKTRVISPEPKVVEGESIKPEVVTSQVSEVTTIELNVNMHCEACAQQLKSKILKMRGVQSAETELSSGKVTVTGTMDAEQLVNYVYRRTRKLAKIVPQPAEQKEEDTKEGEKGEKPAEEAPKAEENAEKKEDEKGDGKDNKEEKAGEEGKKEGEETTNTVEEMAMKMMYWSGPPVYVIERVPPPTLFSDENPNACCIS